MICSKKIVLGITGSIAVYKVCDVVSQLKKLGAEVDIIMTKSATQFVSPLTFESLAKTKVVTDMFEPVEEYDIKHISLAKKGDIFVVCPASANIIAKLANGIADDMLSATYLASNSQKLLCPAMNTNMLNDVTTQNNLDILSKNGAVILDSDTGMLACGDIGKGKLASVDNIVAKIVSMVSPNQDYAGKTVLITAGATEEALDDVRVITNHSSGKMGMALASKVMERGGSVILVYGNISVELSDGIAISKKVKSTLDMLDATLELSKQADIIIMAAAPADYRPKSKSVQKIKSDELSVTFVKNPDISKALGVQKGDKKLIIFSAETENLICNAEAKMKKKNADMVVANDVKLKGAGFFVDTNIATIIDKDGNKTACELMLKSELANIILDKILLL